MSPQEIIDTVEKEGLELTYMCFTKKGMDGSVFQKDGCYLDPAMLARICAKIYVSFENKIPDSLQEQAHKEFLECFDMEMNRRHEIPSKFVPHSQI